MKRYVIRNAQVRDAAVQAVNTLPIADKPLEVVIRPHDPKRTEPQHRKFRAMVRDFLGHLRDHTDYAGTFDDLYEELGERFFGTKDVQRMDGSLRSVRRSNKELSKDEMEAAITRLDVFMAEYGCVSEGNWDG